jgi:transcriptional regulator with XRE-family HTH domain
MSLGENIRNIRKNKGYSIMKIRELTGLSKSTISEIENDKSSPTSDTLEKIANALGVNISDFFDNNPIEDKLDILEEDMKILFSKAKKLSKEDRLKVLKMMEIFEEENN